jgi:hypothetical protein
MKEGIRTLEIGSSHQFSVGDRAVERPMDAALNEA